MKTQTPHPKSQTNSAPLAVFQMSLLLMGIGFVLIATSLFFELKQEDSLRPAASAHHESSSPRRDPSPGASPTLNNGAGETASVNVASEEASVIWWAAPPARFISKTLAEIGLALFSIGGIDLLLEVRFMSDYFQKKIAQTMTQEEYLKKLTMEELERVQADSLKAYWKLEDIDREGTLYDYCKNQVQGFIAKPYRENVKGTYTIESVNSETHEVEEILSYACRAIKKRIQPEIKWSTRKGEIGEVKNFSIRLEIPNDIWDEPEFRHSHPKILEPVIAFDTHDITAEGECLDSAFQQFWKEFKNKRPEIWKEPLNTKPPKLTKTDDGENVVYKLSQNSYEDVDNLRVSLFIKYTVPTGRSLTWQMSHPSKNVSGVINFPKCQNFYLETFGLSKQYLHERDKLSGDSPQTFEYNSWLLPESGFVFHLLPRRDGN